MLLCECGDENPNVEIPLQKQKKKELFPLRCHILN